MSVLPFAAPCAPSKRARAEPGLATILLLFRTTDLRLHDNHALHAAVSEAGRRTTVVPAFVWSPREDGGQWGVHGASEVYLKQALQELDAALTQLGSRLIMRHNCGNNIPGNDHRPGDRQESPYAAEVVALVSDTCATTVHYNLEHTPEGLARDAAMLDAMRSSHPTVQVTAHHSQLLYSPDAVNLQNGFNGGHWGTLMPFLRACERTGKPHRCLPTPTAGDIVPPGAVTGGQWPASCGVDDLQLARMPPGKDWGAAIRAAWPAGEQTAQQACLHFVATGLLQYERDRSRADLFGDDRAENATASSCATSRLSIALRFGELSPRFLYWAIRDAGLPREVTKTFARRLHWRDLAYFQLNVFPEMRTKGIRAHYDSTRWVEPPSEYQRRLRAWQRGMTGYPIVDAGMRELYLTGWMSQSVRMVCASFLVEYLRVSWLDGQIWFGDTLCDADSAINAMMWQNAGRSGIDQWNFVMSPENASQDRTGRYTRKYVPELAGLPNKVLHKPWLASPKELEAAGVKLGTEPGCYPTRVVSDLGAERDASVAAVLEMRRAHQHHNDPRGYDSIVLPNGNTTKVFTKEEYRISKSGSVLPRRPRYRARAVRSGASGKPRGRANGQRSITEFARGCNAAIKPC